MITSALRDMQLNNRTEISVVLDGLKPELLESIDDILSMYPTLDRIWAVLPMHRSDFRSAELTPNENRELDALQFGEDKPVIDGLRDAIKAELEKRRESE